MTREEAYALAQKQIEQNKHALARVLWLRYASIHVDDLPAHRGLTYSYIYTSEYFEAEKHAEIFCLLDPNNPQAHWLYGQLMQINGRSEATALRTYLRLEQLTPAWPGMHLPIAKIYFGQRQIDKARHYFEHALQYAVGDLQASYSAQWEYAMLLLTVGEYARGWLYYEARLKRENHVGLLITPLPATIWQGEPLQGKTIVVHGEQGIGDEIMYASIINDLLAQGANVILACCPSLLQVMQHSFPKIRVFAHRRGPQEYNMWSQGTMPSWWDELLEQTTVDYQVPIGSLANQFRTNKQSFPRTTYLVIDPINQEKQRTLLQHQAKRQGITLTDKRLIGLVWCGNLDNPHGRSKSIELSELSILSKVVNDNNIVFISLQNGQYGKQALEQNELPIVDMSDHTDLFNDTLALASLCEQVITIDTSYFHLCAAAGLPTTLLLRRNCDWRFGWESEDCIWYADNVNIIRQTQDLDWSNVLAALASKLQQDLT